MERFSDLLWVFSRSKKMSAETSAALKSVFEDNTYLRKEELIKVDFSDQGCQINGKVFLYRHPKTGTRVITVLSLKHQIISQRLKTVRNTKTTDKVLIKN